MKNIPVLSLTVLLLFFFFSCGEVSTKKPEGSEGGACYDNGTCDEGLTCVSDICVDLGDYGNDTENDEEADTDDTDTGNTGDSGDTGNTGNTGDTGDSGDTGNTGNTGSNWEDHACYERNGDADADGIPNSVECPEFPCIDNDDDALPDCLDTDSDGDKTSDSEECTTGYLCADTDKDGHPDYLDLDSDSDGLSDKKEKELGTERTKTDTDGDGSDDLAEIAYGSDPLDDSSSIPSDIYYVILPYNAPDDETRTLTFSTKIEAIDVLIVFDSSASMDSEADNLKNEIKTEIIDEISTEFPDSGFAAYGLASFGYETMYEMYQTITLDANEMETAVNLLDAADSSNMTTEAIYQATTGAGIQGHYYTKADDQIIMHQNVNIYAQDCSGKPGNVGGACFRRKSIPIYVIVTDKAFVTAPLASGAGASDTVIWDWASPAPHTLEETLAAMNDIGAKVIGIDSGFDDENVNQRTNLAEDDFELYAMITGSIDDDGKSFQYHTENADGTGIGGQIADAVIALTTWIDMDVLLGRMSDEQCDGQSAENFVKSSKTIYADPPEGVAGQDMTTFFSVTQGTSVLFDVSFYNDFCINETNSWQEFEIDITLLGNGSYLSDRTVHIVVPESLNN